MIANESPRLLDVVMAAKRLHVSPATVRRRIADGQLEAYRVGQAGGIRVRERDVDALLRPVEPRGEA